MFGAGKVPTIIGACLSTALLALNAYTKNFNHGELAQKHKQAASELWLIREKYFSLLTGLAMGEKPIEALQVERDQLLQNLHTAYASAPPTNSDAYAEAQRALKFREDRRPFRFLFSLERCVPYLRLAFFTYPPSAGLVPEKRRSQAVRAYADVTWRNSSASSTPGG